MTLEDLYDVLSSTGIPTVYHSWMDTDSERPSLPFICYSEVYTNNFLADGRVYKRVRHVQIELYEKDRNADTEGLVEDAIEDIPWQSTIAYLDDEGCYQIIYEIEVC